MNNLQGDEWDFSDVKQVPLGLREARRYRLRRGDLLFNRTNSKELVGKCGVFDEGGIWVFASYLIRVRTDAGKLLPEFAAFFINSAAGRIQIDRVSRQIIGMTNVNAEELRQLQIPLPPLAKQRELVNAMESARDARRSKLAEADALLTGMDAYLLDVLKLEAPTPLRKMYAVKARQLSNALSAERYAALQLERSLPWGSSVADAVELIDTRTIPSQVGPEEEWDWIRIDEMRNQPWGVETIRTERGDAIEGPMYQVRESDILLARLGPTILNAKFVLAPKPKRQTVASPEFLVLRCKQGWEPEVVLWLLRMKLFRDIMYLRSRGGTPSRYRLDGDDLLSISFPAAIDLSQRSIATEIRRRRERARALRAEAEQGWAEAKRWFEEQLLGPAA